MSDWTSEGPRFKSRSKLTFQLRYAQVTSLTLSLPVTRICVNFSTVCNDTLVAKGLINQLESRTAPESTLKQSMNIKYYTLLWCELLLFYGHSPWSIYYFTLFSCLAINAFTKGAKPLFLFFFSWSIFIFFLPEGAMAQWPFYIQHWTQLLKKESYNVEYISVANARWSMATDCFDSVLRSESMLRQSALKHNKNAQ